MTLYKREFGESFNLGFDHSEFPWLVDKSWHNDVCPSFTFKAGSQYLVLWVDYEEPDSRELGQERYADQLRYHDISSTVQETVPN